MGQPLMAIRDEHGNTLGGDPLTGVTVTRQTVTTTAYVERIGNTEKTLTEDGALIVQELSAVHARKLPRGQFHSPDGTIRNADGTYVHAPTDEQVERVESIQRINAAREAEQAELRTRGLSSGEIMRGYWNDGSVVRDYRGVMERVCGHTIDRKNGHRSSPAGLT